MSDATDALIELFKSKIDHWKYNSYCLDFYENTDEYRKIMDAIRSLADITEQHALSRGQASA